MNPAFTLLAGLHAPTPGIATPPQSSSAISRAGPA